MPSLWRRRPADRLQTAFLSAKPSLAILFGTMLASLKTGNSGKLMDFAAWAAGKRTGQGPEAGGGTGVDAAG